jgi:hypothetical protein
MAQLDLINIAYYRGGLDSDPLMITAQVGRSNLDMIMDTGAMISSYTRDYFIFSKDLNLGTVITPSLFKPEEGDIILDKEYERFHCKVATMNSLSHYKATNETMVRLRVRTSVVHVVPEQVIVIPDVVATWLRADAVPMSQGVRPEDWTSK